MKKHVGFLMKIVVFSWIVFGLSIGVVYAQESTEPQLYNRNEKVFLSKPLLCENDDYYISTADLSAINVGYDSWETKTGIAFLLSSRDAYGGESTLQIVGELQDIIQDDEVVSQKGYRFFNYMISKKDTPNSSSLNGAVTKEIGEFPSVIFTENDCYISLKTIATAISYEYRLDENRIYLWITDSLHSMLSGEISLPDGEVAPEGGMNVSILLQSGDKKADDNYFRTEISIPSGENQVHYFFEIPKLFDQHIWVMFEFDGNYKTMNEFLYAQRCSLLSVQTEPTQKRDFNVICYMPDGLTAEDDVYATVIFNRFAVHESTEPIIKKGERKGKITLNIDSDFYGNVLFSNITGDENLYSYGYYANQELRILPEKAESVWAGYGTMSVELMRCYKISGQVIPPDINSGYEARVFGYTEFNEKLYLPGIVGDDFSFCIKVPASISEYTLSVAYLPGVYCGYISDGVSSYDGKYHVFENTQDYSGIRLKYELFLPAMPITMNADGRSGRVELMNISDDLVTDVTLYCAHYRQGKLLYLSNVLVPRVMIYSGYQKYTVEYPKEFYKTDEVRFFVFGKNTEPLGIPVVRAVNKADGPYEDMEFYDVDLLSPYYTAIHKLYRLGVMMGYEDGTFHPEHTVMRSEAAMMLCRLLGYNCYTYDFSCDDVPQDHWASSFIGICVNENIFELSENQFRPEESITVSQTYQAIENILKKEGIETEDSVLLDGIDTINMDRVITRAEFAQLLYNYTTVLGEVYPQ